jgi:peptidyl-tRNA hydrolase, PTH1 family
MKLIIGLGNPGKEYHDTRHNAGSRAVELFAAEHKLSFKKHDANARAASGTIETERVICGVSETFMNDSGLAVGALAQFYKVEAGDVVIVYDDIDLPFGTIRVSQNTSSGGHNGIKSIIERLDSSDFIRVRLGIGPKLGDAADYVIGRWSKEQSQALPEFLAEAIGAIETVVQSGLTEAATIYN